MLAAVSRMETDLTIIDGDKM